MLHVCGRSKAAPESFEASIVEPKKWCCQSKGNKETKEVDVKLLQKSRSRTRQTVFSRVSPCCLPIFEVFVSAPTKTCQNLRLAIFSSHSIFAVVPFWNTNMSFIWKN